MASWEPRASPAGEWAPCQGCPPGLGAASGESAPLRDGQEEAARFVSSCLIKCLLHIRSKQDHNRARPPSGTPLCLRATPPRAWPRPGCTPAPPRTGPGALLHLQRPLGTARFASGSQDPGRVSEVRAPLGAQQDGLCPAEARCVWPVTSPGAGRARQKPRGGLEHLLRLGARWPGPRRLSCPLLPGSLAVKGRPQTAGLQ